MDKNSLLYRDFLSCVLREERYSSTIRLDEALPSAAWEGVTFRRLVGMAIDRKSCLGPGEPRGSAGFSNGGRGPVANVGLSTGLGAESKLMLTADRYMVSNLGMGSAAVWAARGGGGRDAFAKPYWIVSLLAMAELLLRVELLLVFAIVLVANAAGGEPPVGPVIEEDRKGLYELRRSSLTSVISLVASEDTMESLWISLNGLTSESGRPTGMGGKVW